MAQSERDSLGTQNSGSAVFGLDSAAPDRFEPGERAVLVNALSSSSFFHLLLVLPLFLYGELVVSQSDLTRAHARKPSPVPASQFVFTPSALAAAQTKQPALTPPSPEPVAQAKPKPPEGAKPKPPRKKAVTKRKTKTVNPQPKRQRVQVAAVAPPTTTGEGSVAAVAGPTESDAPSGPPTPAVEAPTKPNVMANGTPSTFDRKGALKDYIRLLSSAVKKRYKYPRAARRAGLEGRVVVKLVLDDQGRVLQVDLVTSSGHEILDNAALEAARSVKVLPPAPSALEWGKKAIRVPFNFRQTG